jgi:CRISPR-associated exonuclease Cas4
LKFTVSIYAEDNLLLLSGIQHFAFCPRQWALIHIEQQWADNVRTVDGNIFHERTHGEELTERRGDIIITRGIRVQSEKLGVTGQCDVVEFHRSPAGIALQGREGKWQPYPIEYKKGSPKENGADELQLCAQALCLEEILACTIEEGCLFYGEPRRRLRVEFTPEMRTHTKEMLRQMHEYYQRGYTPKPKPAKRCKACSLVNICLPNLSKTVSVRDYIATAMEESA